MFGNPLFKHSYYRRICINVLFPAVQSLSFQFYHFIMWFFVACFWCQKFRWCFIILLVWFGLLSDHLLGNSCPIGWPFVLIAFCLFVVLVISHFDFEDGICLLIALVPVHCLLITFISKNVNAMKTFLYFVIILSLERNSTNPRCSSESDLFYMNTFDKMFMIKNHAQPHRTYQQQILAFGIVHCITLMRV